MTEALAPTSARQRIMVTAERLIGEQGPSASLREIAAEAGQRNTSAVHYHFGSRDGLIEAIVELRQQNLEQERLRLLAEVDKPTVRGMVEVLVRPMFHVPYDDGSTHYARFMEKVRDHPSLTTAALAGHEWPATKAIITKLSALLQDLPLSVREFRMRAVMTTIFALLADAERDAEKRSRRRKAANEGHVIDLLVGMLTAAEAA